MQQWRSDLLIKQPNSLIWAYLVTQYLRNNWKPNFMFLDGVYSYEDMYFSTSHSEDILMMAVDNKKIAVDIEHINQRNDSLLHKVKIPHSNYSTRENFYLQRCAKECLVKFLNLTSNDMKDMKIIRFTPHSHFSVDERWFHSLLTLRFKWTEYSIHVDLKNGRVMSLLQDDTTLTDNQAISSMYNMQRTGMFKPID